MDKKFREKITVALQKLEQYGGKVSWPDDYSVICTFEYNFAKTYSISGFQIKNPILKTAYFYMSQLFILHKTQDFALQQSAQLCSSP